VLDEQRRGAVRQGKNKARRVAHKRCSPRSFNYRCRSWSGVLVVGAEDVLGARCAPARRLLIDSLMLAAVADDRSQRRLRCRGAAKAIEDVVRELLPGRWRVGDREAAAVASTHAFKAEPPVAKIGPDAHVTGRRVHAPHLPLKTFAVSKDP